jgi:hypothetical protein
VCSSAAGTIARLVRGVVNLHAGGYARLRDDVLEAANDRTGESDSHYTCRDPFPGGHMFSRGPPMRCTFAAPRSK